MTLCDDVDLFHSKVSLGRVCSTSEGKTFQENEQNIYDSENKIHLSLPWVYIRVHAYNHKSQTSLLVSIPDLR